MANIKPFRGIRPSKDKVHLIVSQSIDRYSKAEMNVKMITNPFSFLHIIRPESFDGIKPRSGSREQLLLIKEKSEINLNKLDIKNLNLQTFCAFDQNRVRLQF
jgi:uncharacterized protein (DUF1015 family)